MHRDKFDHLLTHNQAINQTIKYTLDYYCDYTTNQRINQFYKLPQIQQLKNDVFLKNTSKKWTKQKQPQKIKFDPQIFLIKPKITVPKYYLYETILENYFKVSEQESYNNQLQFLGRLRKSNNKLAQKLIQKQHKIIKYDINKKLKSIFYQQFNQSFDDKNKYQILNYQQKLISSLKPKRVINPELQKINDQILYSLLIDFMDLKHVEIQRKIYGQWFQNAKQNFKMNQFNKNMEIQLKIGKQIDIDIKPVGFSEFILSTRFCMLFQNSEQVPRDNKKFQQILIQKNKELLISSKFMCKIEEQVANMRHKLLKSNQNILFSNKNTQIHRSQILQPIKKTFPQKLDVPKQIKNNQFSLDNKKIIVKKIPLNFEFEKIQQDFHKQKPFLKSSQNSQPFYKQTQFHDQGYNNFRFNYDLNPHQFQIQRKIKYQRSSFHNPESEPNFHHSNFNQQDKKKNEFNYKQKPGNFYREKEHIDLNKMNSVEISEKIVYKNFNPGRNKKKGKNMQFGRAVDSKDLKSDVSQTSFSNCYYQKKDNGNKKKKVECNIQIEQITNSNKKIKNNIKDRIKNKFQNAKIYANQTNLNKYNNFQCDFGKQQIKIPKNNILQNYQSNKNHLQIQNKIHQQTDRYYPYAILPLIVQQKQHYILYHYQSIIQNQLQLRFLVDRIKFEVNNVRIQINPNFKIQERQKLFGYLSILDSLGAETMIIISYKNQKYNKIGYSLMMMVSNLSNMPLYKVIRYMKNFQNFI